MDAYDIFKKLTKGLTFKHKVLGVKNNRTTVKPLTTAKKEEEFKEAQEEIKEEQFSEEEDNLNLDSDTEHSDNESETEEAGQGSDKDELTLLEGIKVKEKKIKKKKEKTEDSKKKLELEEDNRFRNDHGIKAVGRHIPAALNSFPDLVTRYNIAQSLVDVITKCGYSEPTPVQRQALPCLLEDRQILACAPTGSGKTAAFLIPVIHSLGAAEASAGGGGGPRALVLCPTRELACQIHREALRLTESIDLRCSLLRTLKLSKIKEREATFKKSDIVITTPNRLCYLLNHESVNVTLDKVKWLIIDEADKLFEGSAETEGDFRQQLDEVMRACGGRQRRVAMFSATHTPAIAKWTRRNLRGLINITVGQRNAATSLVEQELQYCGSEGGKLVAFRQLVQQGLKPPVLVFVQSKDRAKQLFKELIYDGINVDVIHADRTQLQRDNVVRSFRVCRTWVLVCTELMARGIDFRGVNLVVNYDFPPSAISYIHRIGRAGRAGQKGKAITFFTQDDVANLRSIASVMKQSGCEVPEYMLQLKKDSNKRKRLLKSAPKRDQISTVITKNANKRKLEAEKEARENGTTKDTEKIKHAKPNKQRKVQNLNKQNKNPKSNKKANNNKKEKSLKNKKGKSFVAKKVK